MAVIERTRSEEIALGMTLLGVIFSSILYGVSLSQAYTYYKRFPHDSWKVKVPVVLVTVLDTASMVLVSHASWYYLVTTGSAKLSIWSLNVELALSMVISGLTESFLAYQVWLLSDRNTFLTVVLMCLALAHFISGEISAVEFLALHNFAKFGSVKIPSILRLGSAAVCDTSLAISLCYFLHRKRTGYKQTDVIIDHLILFTLNSGLINCVASIFALVTYIVIPKTWVYLALCFLISRLYANTFLSSLNSRHSFRGPPADNTESQHMPQFRSNSRLGHMGRTRTPMTTIDICVVTETISDGGGFKGGEILERPRTGTNLSDAESSMSDIQFEPKQ